MTLSSCIPAGLSTAGTAIINKNGYPVRFRGTTWYGFNVPNYGEPCPWAGSCWAVVCPCMRHRLCVP
jgi:hypothetical protein